MLQLIKKTNTFQKILQLFIFCLISNLQAQSSKIVTSKDYGKWERINWNISFNNDGTWVQYGITTNNKDKTLVLTNTKTKKSKKIKNADRARFSADNKWVAYSKVLTGKEQKKLALKNKGKKKKKKAPQKMSLLNLANNDSTEFKDVVNFKFSGANGYLAMKRTKNKVNTLIVKNLKTGIETTFGNVKEYEWQDEGMLLAMLINTQDKVGNSIQLYNPENGNLKVLDQKNKVYTGLKWRKKSDDLLVLRTSKDELYKGNSFDILLWKQLRGNRTIKKVFSQNNFSNFPKNTKLRKQGIQFSKDGNVVFFKTEYRASTENKKSKNDKKSKPKEELADLEIWNSSDLHIIPAQKRNSNYGTKLAAWNTSNNTFYYLENDLLDRVRLQTNVTTNIAQDQTPYDFEIMFGRPNYDLYAINTTTGASKKVVTKANRYWSVSKNNQYFVYLSNDNLHLFNLINGTSTNITKGLDATFINFEDDHPIPQKPAFGFVGWSEDSKTFYVNSEFDVWQFYTDGSTPKKLTNGKASSSIYRYQNFDRDQEYINTKKPIYFSTIGKFSKKSGLSVLANGKLKSLIFKDARVSNFRKAKKSNDVVYMVQSYTQSPNLFLTNTSFNTSKQISNTNSFQKDYAWGKAELISYTNINGKKAQAILYYPANYKKRKKYPMITYIYEKLSNGFHSYSNPNSTNYYNTTVWVQNGYFVLKPDIEFTAGDPGISSAKNLEKVVKKVVDMGSVDAKRVGLIGHSWGGYQAGYVPTQTNVFAASVAGAGLTELISMNLAITPAFGGTPENEHFEVSQERMVVAPWKAPEKYLRNSSVMNIEKLNTPILFEVGDNDQNVNWFQGIAYYNAARRAAKPFVLLVYAKEGHGLRKEKNQKDYQQRILSWFGHYLKGEPAKDWITKGIDYKEQRRRLRKN